MFEDKSKEFDRALLLLDAAAVIIAFFSAYGLQSSLLLGDDLNFFSHISLLPMILALMLFHLSYFKAYGSPRQIAMAQYSWAVFISIMATMAALMGFLFLMRIEHVSRFVIYTFVVLVFFLLVIIRIGIIAYFRRDLKQGKNFHRVLIIGTGARACHLSRVLCENAEWGIDIIGHLDPQSNWMGAEIPRDRILGTVRDISIVLKQHVVDEVLLAVPRSLISDVESIAYACEEEGIKLGIMADLYDLDAARVSLSKVDSVPLLTLEPVALDENKLLVKRIIDILAVVLAIPFLLPLMACIAIAIKLDSPGPIFFIQERIGLRKRPFKMIKFRSMYIGSEERLKELEHLNEAQGPIFKMTNDPRVTRVGRFIRRTSLDELPQLFNVLGGSMSLVGPRPMSVRDVNLFDRGIQRKRFSVKPGITCLWQISGRSNLPFSKWLEFDLEYIEKWSLCLDLQILFKTIPIVLKGRGAM